MLIKRHDAPLAEDEWRAFLASHDFGELKIGRASCRERV